MAFELLDDVRVVSAQVREARNLLFERDPLISSQRTLGYVTGIRAAERLVDGDQDAQRIFVPAALADAEMGIDLSSNILRLAEGRRTIVVRIALQPRQSVELPTTMPKTAPGGSARLAPVAEQADETAHARLEGGGDLAAASGDVAAQEPTGAASDVPQRERDFIAALRRADTADEVRSVLGQLVAETLVEGRAWPNGALRELLLEKLETHAPERIDDPVDAPYRMDAQTGEATAEIRAVDEVRGWFDREPAEIYQRFLAGGFRVSLSTEAGPVAASNARAIPNRPQDGPGFTLRMVLDEAVPPIAPEAGASVPVLRIRMDDQSLFCPFSLFEDYAIDRITTEVKVEGLKALTGFSDDGPLDLSQPFAPFGAIPQDGAAFLVGARELALKQVTRVAVNLTWSGLPREPGGFYDHYEGYGPEFKVPRPGLRTAYLTAEGWKELDTGPVAMTVQRTGQVGLGTCCFQSGYP